MMVRVEMSFGSLEFLLLTDIDGETIGVNFLSIPSRSLGQRSKTHPLIISLLSLNDLGKDADANKIDVNLPLTVPFTSRGIVTLFFSFSSCARKYIQLEVLAPLFDRQ